MVTIIASSEEDAIKQAEEIIQKDIESWIVQQFTEAAFTMHSEIVQNTPVDTGNLRASIVIEETPDGFVIGTACPYAENVEMGTGIYGPHKEPIVPTTKQALAWGKDIGDGKKEFVFRSVKGQKPAHMFLKGVSKFETELNKRFNITHYNNRESDTKNTNSKAIAFINKWVGKSFRSIFK